MHFNAKAVLYKLTTHNPFQHRTKCAEINSGVRVAVMEKHSTVLVKCAKLRKSKCCILHKGALRTDPQDLQSPCKLLICFTAFPDLYNSLANLH